MNSNANGNDELVIQTRGLTVSYGERQVLSNIDLDVRRGEILAVVGGSGCLVRLLPASADYDTAIDLVTPTLSDVMIMGVGRYATSVHIASGEAIAAYHGTTLKHLTAVRRCKSHRGGSVVNGEGCV